MGKDKKTRKIKNKNIKRQKHKKTRIFFWNRIYNSLDTLSISLGLLVFILQVSFFSFFNITQVAQIFTDLCFITSFLGKLYWVTQATKKRLISIVFSFRHWSKSDYGLVPIGLVPLFSVCFLLFTIWNVFFPSIDNFTFGLLVFPT